MNNFSPTSVFLRQQLDHVINLAFQEDFPSLKARSFIPVNRSIPATAETVSTRIWDTYGEAKIINSSADDLPSVAIGQREASSSIKTLGCSFECVIEPTKLFLAWESYNDSTKTYIVAELNRLDNDEITLRYLRETNDFIEAEQNCFESYTAFPDKNKTYYNVLGAFRRRIMSRRRGDFPKYLAKFGLNPSMQFSDFALLGYSGGKLLCDHFSFIRPFANTDGLFINSKDI